MDRHDKSRQLAREFAEYYPGNHTNLRHTVVSHLFIDHAKGSRMWDADGNEYIDFCRSLGPTILGSCDEEFVKALKDNLEKSASILGSGMFFGADDLVVAQKIIKYVPCAEQLKFQVTGTEAVQAAIRIARGYTGKSKIIRFAGHYHGWADNIFGGQIRPRGDGEFEIYKDFDTDDELSQGLSPYAWDDVIMLPWNDFDALKIAFERHHDEIAIVHFEGIVCNLFAMYPKPGFLELIRELCDKYNVVMSMDEIITGFSTGLGGAQALLGVTPDICTMAKSISNGLPMSLVAGKKKIMTYCFSDRKVISPGTYNGWNLGMAAVKATIEALEKDDGARHKHMLELQEELTVGVEKLAAKYKMDIRISECPSVIYFLFGMKGGRKPLYTMDELADLDMEYLTRIRAKLQEEGLLMLPGLRFYMTLAHTEEDIEFALNKFDKVLREISQE